MDMGNHLILFECCMEMLGDAALLAFILLDYMTYAKPHNIFTGAAEF